MWFLDKNPIHKLFLATTIFWVGVVMQDLLVAINFFDPRKIDQVSIGEFLETRAINTFFLDTKLFETSGKRGGGDWRN